jgi:hypothetical protein
MGTKTYNFKLSCSKEVHDLITKKCVDEYLKNYPEMQGRKITQNHILYQLAKYYLEN